MLCKGKYWSVFSFIEKEGVNIIINIHVVIKYVIEDVLG